MEAEKEKEIRHINRTVAMIRKPPKKVEPTYTNRTVDIDEETIN